MVLLGLLISQKKDRKKFPILKLHEAIMPNQPDKCNCGVIWYLFIYDLMMQASIPYNFDVSSSPNPLPLSMGIGKTWLEPNLFERLKADPSAELYKDKAWKKKKLDYSQIIYKIFCEEIIVCLERLHLLQLQNNLLPKHIMKPDGWGVIPERYKKLIHRNLKKQLWLPKATENVKNALKTERKLQNKIMQESEPIIPGGLLMGATTEILGNDNLYAINPNPAFTPGKEDELAWCFLLMHCCF